MLSVNLTQGKATVLEGADASICEARWYALRNGRTFYAVRKVTVGSRSDGGKRQALVHMHRVVAERMLGRALASTELVDHINGNGLDNRRENLRVTDRHGNARNRRSAQGKTSEFLGVCWNTKRAKWQVSIRIPSADGGAGRKAYLGIFGDEREAARAYDAAAREHFGEFARLNFPEGRL